MNKIISIFFISLSIVGCTPTSNTNTNQENRNDDDYTEAIFYDSTYWCYDTLSGKENKILAIEDMTTKIELDSMGNDSLEASKQVLKDIYLAYWRRNRGNNDPDSRHYENFEEFKKETSAFLTYLYYYLYSHGYKKIDEELFKQRLQKFYKRNWSDFLEFGDFYGSDLQKDYLEEGISYPDFLCVLNNRVIYRYILQEPLNYMVCNGENTVMIEGNIEEYKDESEISSEPFQGEKFEFMMDLEKLLYEHLFIFNDNKAAKNWLLHNRMDFFFNDIVYYDEDNEINRKKLDYLIKKCTSESGEMQAGREFYLVEAGLKGWHNNMMRLIFDETDKAMTAYENGGVWDVKAFDLVSDFFQIVWVKENDYSMKERLYLLEQLCMFAKMEVSLNKKHCKTNNYGWFNNGDALSMTFQFLNDSLLTIAKKENYYNIPNFDEVLEVYNWDANHSYKDKSGIPFDYTTLLKGNTKQ